MTRSRILFAALLLVGLLPLLSGAATAQPSAVGLAKPAAPVSTAFTYQGQLTDNGGPANGVYDLRFILYNALAGGAQVGPIVNSGDVAVADGLFTVALDFGPVFDGTALWLEIAVRPGASTGGYTILSPRQPLTAAPYALGLRSGATVKQNAASSALNIEGAGDGLHISRVEGSALRVDSAGNGGVYIVDSDKDAIHIDNAGLDGVDINYAATDGLQVDGAGRHGITVGSVARDGLVVNDAGRYGVRVSSAISTGLYIDNSGEDGIFICSAGTETDCTPSTTNNGVEIGRVQHRGVSVGSAGSFGLYVGSADTGLAVASASYYGVNVDGNALAGVFWNDIQVDGSCTGCTLATFAVNSSDQPLQPGDVVTVQGVQASGVDGVPVLMGVVPAGAGQSIVGVVDGRAEIHIDDEPRLDTIGKKLIPRDGPAQPGEYVTIITYGLAPVNVGDSLSARSITAGSKLALDAGGSARSLRTAVVEGIQISGSVPTVGLALSSPDETGQVWVLVNPQ